MGVACEGGSGDNVTLCALVEGGRRVLVVTMESLLHSIQFLVQEQLLGQATKVPLGVPWDMTRLGVVVSSHSWCVDMSKK